MKLTELQNLNKMPCLKYKTQSSYLMHKEHHIKFFLTKIRVKKGLTQKELASLMNVNPQIISLYENGKKVPTVFSIIKMLEALDCKFEDLFEY